MNIFDKFEKAITELEISSITVSTKIWQLLLIEFRGPESFFTGEIDPNTIYETKMWVGAVEIKRDPNEPEQLEVLNENP